MRWGGKRTYDTATEYKGHGGGDRARGQYKGQNVNENVVTITFRSVKETGNKFHPGYFVVDLKSGGRYALARGVSPPQFEFYFKKNTLKDEQGRVTKERKKAEKALAPPSGARKLMNAVSSALCGGRPC